MAVVMREVITQPTMRSDGGCLSELFVLDLDVLDLGSVPGMIMTYALVELRLSSGIQGAESALLTVESTILTYKSVKPTQRLVDIGGLPFVLVCPW
jgi:hypothetical protein